MVEKSVSHHVKSFSKARKNARDVLSLRIVEDARSFQELDKHINSLLDRIKADADNNDPALLKKDVKAFESELHEELELLFRKSQQDLDLFIRVLNSLSSFRSFLSSHLNDDSFSSLSDSELGYAGVLKDSIIDKLDTLKLLFKKLKK